MQPSCSEEISAGDLFHASRPGLAFLPEPVPVAMKGVINVSTTAKDEPVGEISDTAAQGLLDGKLSAGLEYTVDFGLRKAWFCRSAFWR